MNFKINKIAEASIKECRGAGVNLTDENIITIYELGKIADATIGTGLRYYNGKRVGNITVYPLTMGARLWLQYEAVELTSPDEKLYDWATLWAFTHANDYNQFEFKDARDFKRTIKKWGKTISCNDIELRDALIEIGGTSDSEKKSKESKEDNVSKNNFSPILNFLITNYGKDIHYWLWEVNEDFCSMLINEYIKSNNNKKIAINKDDTNIISFLRLKKYIANLKAQIVPVSVNLENKNVD